MTLWEMLQVYAHSFIKLLNEIRDVEGSWSAPRTNPEQELLLIGNKLGKIKLHCESLMLPSALKQIRFLIEQISPEAKGFNSNCPQEFPHILSELRRRVLEDMEDRVFLCLDRDKTVEFCKAVDIEGLGIANVVLKSPEEIFGENVCNSFPSTLYDLTESVRCFLLARGTACVFHLMRALEIPLSCMAAEFGINSAHTNWQPIIDQIQSAVTKAAKNPASLPGGKEDVEFYSQATSYLITLKDGWRNYTAHHRGKYTEEEAELMLRNLRAFLQKLSVRLAEPVPAI